MDGYAEWAAFAQDKRAVRMHSLRDGEIRTRENSSVYRLTIERVDALRPPGGLQMDAGDVLRYDLSLVFFCRKSNSFYGRQWYSPLFEERGGSLPVEFSCFFKSNFVDPQCLAVLELRACAVEAANGRLKKRVAVGFSLLDVFAGDVNDTRPVFAGSVFSMIYDSNAAHLRPLGAKLDYSLRRFSEFGDLQVLLSPDCFFGCNDVLPGLLFLGGRGNEIRDFRVLPSSRVELRGATLGPFDQFDNFVLTCLRQEFQLSEDDRKSLSILEKTLRLQCHNGWTLVSSSQAVALPLGSLAAIPALQLQDFVPDPRSALVVSVEYCCRVRTRTVTFLAGYAFCLPFASGAFQSPVCAGAPPPHGNQPFSSRFRFQSVPELFPKYAYKGGDLFVGGELAEFGGAGARAVQEDREWMPQERAPESKGGTAPPPSSWSSETRESLAAAPRPAGPDYSAQPPLFQMPYAPSKPQTKEQSTETDATGVGGVVGRTTAELGATDRFLQASGSAYRSSSSPIASPERTRHRAVSPEPPSRRPIYRSPLRSASADEEGVVSDEDIESAMANNPLLSQAMQTSLQPSLRSGGHATIATMAASIARPTAPGLSGAFPEAPPLGSGAPLALSRAAEAELTKYQSLLFQAQSFLPGSASAMGADMDLELYDPLARNEVNVHFTALQSLPGGPELPPSVRISYQFFNFSEKMSELMVLKEGSSSLRVLLRDPVYGKESVPLPHQYVVDLSKTRDRNVYLSYLREGSMTLLLWHGESGILWGTVTVALAPLLRQQKPKVSFAAQYDVIEEDPVLLLRGRPLAKLVVNLFVAGSPGEGPPVAPSHAPGSTLLTNRPQARLLSDADPALRKLLESQSNHSSGASGMRITRAQVQEIFERFSKERGYVDGEQWKKVLDLMSCPLEQAQRPESKQGATLGASVALDEVVDQIYRRVAKLSSIGDLSAAYREIDQTFCGTISQGQFDSTNDRLGVLSRDDSLVATLHSALQRSDGVVDYALFLALLKECHNGGFREVYRRLRDLRGVVPYLLDSLDPIIRRSGNHFAVDTLIDAFVQLGFVFVDADGPGPAESARDSKTPSTVVESTVLETKLDGTGKSSDEIIQNYSMLYKQKLMSELIKGEVLEELAIEPMAGRLYYFEYPLQNTQSYPNCFRVHVEPEDGDLQLIHDASEWTLLKGSLVPLAGGEGRVERELVTHDGMLVVHPNERVFIPFKFMTHSTDTAPRTVSIQFQSTQLIGSKTLRVQVKPAQPIVHKHIFLACEENSFLQHSFLLPATDPLGAGARGTLYPFTANLGAVVEYTDATTAQPQSVTLRTRIGAYPDSQSFLLHLYSDVTMVRLQETWRITLSPMMPLAFTLQLGQATHVTLQAEGDHRQRRVRAYSSLPGLVHFIPETVFSWFPEGINRFEMVLLPRDEGRLHVVVHLVDLDENRVLAAWTGEAEVRVPKPSKEFSLSLPVRTAARKTVAYLNPWRESRSYHVVSSDECVLVENATLFVPAGGSAALSLFCRPQEAAGSRQVLLLVNDEADKTEDCLLLRLRFA